MRSQDDLSGWQSGWLGVHYGTVALGVAELEVGGPRTAIAWFWISASDGDVYQSFRVRYDRHQQAASFPVSLGEPGDLWATEERQTVPAADRAMIDPVWRGDTVRPNELFTVMASLFADHVVVLARSTLPTCGTSTLGTKDRPTTICGSRLALQPRLASAISGDSEEEHVRAAATRAALNCGTVARNRVGRRSRGQPGGLAHRPC